jgi:hypothetical protein
MSIITPRQMSEYVLQTMRDCVAKEFSELTEEERELKTAGLLRIAGDLRMTGETCIEQIESARIRMMQEAYNFADKGDFESYNGIKVMATDILALIENAVDAEREACADICEGHYDTAKAARAIRERKERANEERDGNNSGT